MLVRVLLYNFAIKGHTDKRINLMELVKLRTEDNSAEKSWLIICKEILVKIIKNLEYFSIMWDETSNCSLK